MRKYFSEIIRMHIPERREHQETDSKVSFSKPLRVLEYLKRKKDDQFMLTFPKCTTQSNQNNEPSPLVDESCLATNSK
jgi:hypothetical protein